MKKFNHLLSWSLFAIMLISISCSKGGSGGGGNPPPPPPPPGQTLTVIPSKTAMYADGWEEITFTVKNQNNLDVTSASQIYVNNSVHGASTFYTSTAGTYKIKALSNGITSPEVDVVATDPGPAIFSQKILVEDYTGTWCGHCPRVGINLENYINAGNPNTIVVANHGPSNDPYTFSQHQSLSQNIFGSSPAVAITGYPNVAVDRSFKWNEQNSQLNTQFTNRRPPVGIAMNTSVAGTVINVTAKVKFDVNTMADTKLVAYLVEDGLVYPQVNYGYFGLPNPIQNYVHKSTLRASATNLFGDMIDKSSQTKGTVWTKNLVFSSAGYNVNNLRVVAFVVVGNNNMNKKGVLNVQTVKVGENKDFD